MTVAVIVLASILFAVGYLGMAALVTYLSARWDMDHYDDLGMYVYIGCAWPVFLLPLLAAQVLRAHPIGNPFSPLRALAKLGFQHNNRKPGVKS